MALIVKGVVLKKAPESAEGKFFEILERAVLEQKRVKKDPWAWLTSNKVLGYTPVR
jgi:hypothetical protein